MVDIFAMAMLASVPNAFEYMEFDVINTDHPPDGTKFFSNKAFEIDRGSGTMRVPTGLGWGVELKPSLLINATNRTSLAS